MEGDVPCYLIAKKLGGDGYPRNVIPLNPNVRIFKAMFDVFGMSKLLGE